MQHLKAWVRVIHVWVCFDSLWYLLQHGSSSSIMILEESWLPSLRSPPLCFENTELEKVVALFALRASWWCISHQNVPSHYKLCEINKYLSFLLGKKNCQCGALLFDVSLALGIFIRVLTAMSTYVRWVRLPLLPLRVIDSCCFVYPA